MLVASCGSASDGDDEVYAVAADPPLPVTAPASAFDPGAGISAVDGSVVVGIEGGELRFRAGTGDLVASVPVASGAELRAVGADGTRAAVLEELEGNSRISVIEIRTGATNAPGVEPAVQSFELEGLVEPEAFATDGSLLFVIDHQVAEEPGVYRVRPLNLATGELETIVGPEKVPFTDNMRGISRRQVWSPDGSRLYTLYIRQTNQAHDGHDHGGGTDGFVHVLDLDEEWAYCLGLPAPFGAGDLASTALAVSPGGDTIAVADRDAGRIAFASTAELAVTRTGDIADLAPGGELHLAVTAEHVVLGGGREVRWLDRATLTSVSSAAEELDGELAGLTANTREVLAWPLGGLTPETLEPPGPSISK